MRAVRSVVVVKALPHRQLLLEIYIIFVSQELVELVLVGPVRSLDLPIELWCSRLDVDVVHALVRDVPVEESLELVAAVRADRLDPERELLDHVVDEVDCVGLRMALVDLQRPNACGIIDRRVLVAPNRAASFPLQSQELDVHLHVMPRHLLLVAVRVYGPPSDAVRESAHAMSPADPIDRRIGGLDVVVALQVPHDPNRPHVIRPTQVQDLFHHIIGGLVRVVVGATPSATRETLIT